MKFSHYNNIVKYGQKHALYNSLTDKVILIDNELSTILRTVITEGIDKLQFIHPSFFETLVKEKFLIHSKINELNQVKKFARKVDFNDSIYYLTINPTMNCNFKCWYCYETHVKSSRLKKTVFDSLLLFISKTVKEQKTKTFNLSFFGGEPLLCFKEVCKPLIDYSLKECDKYQTSLNLSFTTNGLLINDDFINYFINNNLTISLQITFDGYKEQHDKVRFLNMKKGSYDTIVTNINKLLQFDNFHVTARINYTDENIHDCFKISNDFQSINIQTKKSSFAFDFHRVWQNCKADNIHLYVSENIEKLRSRGFIVLNNLPNNVMNSCYADKINSCVINYNGDAFKCTARDFETRNREGYLNNLGVIIWEHGSLDKRMSSKFKNSPCLDCSILPLCNGGCSQQALENENTSYCIYNNSLEKNEIIIKKIDEILFPYTKE